MKVRYWTIGVFSILGLSAVTVYRLLCGSYPHMDGEESLKGLSSPVLVQRDEYGIATVRGQSRLDIARATGFLHAQDRFFQMDLMRRMAAGEMSELFGDVVLDLDKERRIHGFRQQAAKIWPTLSPYDKSLVEAYVEGVNSGLESLSCKPFEYFLLNATPMPWSGEDSLLVGLGLFFDLQEPMGCTDWARGIMKAKLPPQVYDFFVHNGSTWEASLDKSSIPLLAVPDREAFKYLETAKEIASDPEKSPPKARGSNQWAVKGSSTTDGKSLLACDMHLNLFVPNIWYRLAIQYPSVEISGVSLPGTPFIAAGSNRSIAWGFTNGYVDTTDLVLIDIDPMDSNRYLSPEGSLPFEDRIEEIKIKGKPSCFHTVRWTKWGPLHPKLFLEKPVAIRWIAHDLDAFNFRLVDLEKTTSVEDALEVASTVRIPVMNFMVADREGHIGWSFLGAVPKRSGYEPGLPVSFTDGTKRWTGLRKSDDLPKILDPEAGRLWTANNRVLGDLSLGRDQLNSIRAYQIQKRLFSSDLLSMQNMVDLQLDDEAIFFNRWRSLLLETLDPQNQIYPFIEQWDGRCSADSLGYFWIRTFREQVKKTLLKRILAPCFLADPDLDLAVLDLEEPIYLIASQKPAHLANGSWEEEFKAIVNEMMQEEKHDVSWGQKNQALIKHPLSPAVPFLSSWLDMPKDSLSGDYYVPRLAGPIVGASLRMVVSPSHEEEGILSVPCGQSGHPLSPHYRDQHAAWIEGKATPFLPGKTIHELKLIP